MRNSNFKPCPHVTSWRNRHETSTGVIFLCDECQAEFEAQLADKLHGMMGSILTPKEWAKIYRERETMRLEREMEEAIKVAHVVAGYPMHMLLHAPVAV